MNALDDSILITILANDGSVLFNDESDIVEYKSTFDWNDNELRAKYSKSIAALCNAKGGYIVFGIADKTKDILGITGFDQLDPASIANHLNNYFSPSIVFFKRSVSLNGKEIGIIYVAPYNDIPTICTRTFTTILKDGALFYRYPGKSEIIKGTDLIHLLHQIKGSNSKELVGLKKIELKENARPLLTMLYTGGEGHIIDIILKNIGKRAKVMSITPSSKNINIWNVKLPCVMEQNGQITIKCVNSDGTPTSFHSYDLDIFYQDAIETNYLLKISVQMGRAKPADPMEIE